MSSTKGIKYDIEPVRMTGVEALEEYLLQFGDNWVFRAQSPKHALTTSLERDCEKSGYDLEDDAKKIEEEMIRLFARVYDGVDSEKVQNDKLYCLSLMRHFGAPTRLLDFTYSRYVAIYFALEYAYEDEERSAAIWCIDMSKLANKVRTKNPSVSELIEQRIEDRNRTNETFDLLYMDSKYTFVFSENPVQLHSRLNLQQGVFLCPGNIRKSFEGNLFHPYEKPTRDIRKVIFKPDDLREAFKKYYRMNLTRQSLFPGLDGFALSMRYQLWLYKMLYDWREDCRKGNLPKK